MEIHQIGEKYPLIIAFSGLYHGLSMPIFEFKKVLQKFDVNIIFLKDHYQMWYFNGIKNYSKNLEETVILLASIIKKINPTKVITLGVSLGGFAAILYGNLLEVDSIIAFSPQTFIDKENRLMYEDDRWKDKINKLYKQISNHKYFDLLNLENKNQKIDIAYGIRDKFDKYHAERMKQTNIIRVDGDHIVVKKMRNNGELDKLIQKHL